MTTNEAENEYKDLAEHENRLKNAQPKYLTEGKKRYLLASSEESLQALKENQNAELTKVLISLKSEHDAITLESDKIQRQIDEYDKKIKMIQLAEEASKAEEEQQKKQLEFMNEGISAKKERKDEEEYNKKSLLKQREKINKDLLILQKEIIKYENESQVLDKKLERAGLDQNLIKEKKNQVFSQIESQRQKNNTSLNENDLKIKQYKKMIELKSAFLRFSDERKEIQNQIAQKAKNDALDKQEVEKRKTLKLLMLYNQYLRTLMDEELKQNEDLENIFQEIRDIVGTKNLDEIVDFIMNRNKRYNYACQEIEDCEKMNKKLKKEIKWLKENLVVLKNDLLVQEKDENQKELEIELANDQEEEMKIIEKEKEKNRELLELGKKYNEVEKAYQLVFHNIATIVENEKQNPLNVQIEDEGERTQNNFGLTNDELKNYDDVEVKREERSDLDKYDLTEEETAIVNNVRELTQKDMFELEKNELAQLNNIIRKDEEDNNIRDEDNEIINEILAVELTEEEKNKSKKIELSEEEEKIATQKLQRDEKELSSEKKKQRLDNFRELKLKYRKYCLKEKQINAGYKIKKLKKQKDDLINDYQLLLKKVAKTFDALYLCHNKQEFLNMMEEKKVEISGSSSLRKPQTKKPTKRLTKLITRRGSVNNRYTRQENKIIVNENKDEEDDKSNYDPDAKILSKFMKEQNKEKENFISGKIKIAEDKNN
jgi:hypothetical protein